jgi:collagenase-like PrtC family protease
VIDYLTDAGIGPDVITTTSPAIAHMVKEEYPHIHLKASVNMRISTVKGMQYIAHLFDSYCVAKECNRNLPQLKELKNWAENNGKKITILANSGCMRDCSGQVFHDNMVAHEAEIAKQKKAQKRVDRHGQPSNFATQ